MRQSNITVQYSLIQAFFWMAVAAASGFASLFLLAAGYTSAQVGMLIAAANLLSAAIQPFVAALADRPGAPSARRFVIYLSALAALNAVGLFFCHGKVLIGLIYGCTITLLQTNTGLVNAMGVLGTRQPNFGIARGMGSVGYAVLSFGLGFVAEWLGVQAVPAAALFCAAALMMTAVRYPEYKNAGTENRAAADSPLAFFGRYPRYALALAGLVLVFTSHNFITSFTYQIIVTKGGGSSEMGTSMAVAALVELPPMFFFLTVLKWGKSHFWFRLSGFFFTLRILGTLLCTTVSGFYAVQIFQMMGWGLLSVCSAYYIKLIMEPEDAVKGQAYYTVSITVGNVLGAMLGGWLIDQLGVSAMLTAGTLIGLTGSVIILFSAQKTEV